jgi:hypothetical protein
MQTTDNQHQKRIAENTRRRVGKKEPSRMVPNGKAQECFHVVFQSTKVIYSRRFMINAFKFYGVQGEKLPGCRIYDVLTQKLFVLKSLF